MTVTTERPTSRPGRRLRAVTPRLPVHRRTPDARPRAPRPPRPAPSPANQALTTSLTMLAMVSLWLLLQLLYLGSLSHERDQELLYGDFRAQLAEMTAPLGPVVEPGEPVALLRAPAIGLEEVVVEGTASGDTLAGPGHRRDTVLPGQVGTSVVYGRAATYGAPFADLTALVEGATITAVTGQGEQDFTVIAVRRDGDSLPEPAEAGAARLTLVTGEGSGRLASLRPSDTVYVDAEARKGFPAPSGRPSALPTAEESMAIDTSALPLLVLHLGLLLGAVVTVVLARQRWSAGLVWVVAAPVVLVVAWSTTDVAMRLLPNLL